MRSHRIHSRTLVGLLCIASLGVCAYRALAAAMSAGQPTAVVTVNLAKVLEKLDQRVDSETNLKKMVDSMRVEDQKKSDELKKMKADLDAMADSSAKEELRDKFVLMMFQHEAAARFMADRLDIESALLLQDLYKNIKLTVAQMARSSNFDVVLVDDSQGELVMTADSKVPREAQIRQQIAGRRLLYTNPGIDITDALIVRMNNEYKSGSKSAAASP
jgi:Skp family chaperone for outer membrane proteins